MPIASYLQIGSAATIFIICMSSLLIRMSFSIFFLVLVDSVYVRSEFYYMQWTFSLTQQPIVAIFHVCMRVCICETERLTPDSQHVNWTELNIHMYTRLTALRPGLPGWAGTRKVKPIWILLKQETVSGSGISWALCKSAPRSRQINKPAPHHLVFYRPDALPAA